MIKKYKFDIDLNISRQNVLFLENSKYEPIQKIDKQESITPRTNKGHINKEDFSKYLNTQDLNTQEENTKNLLSDQMFVKKYQYKDSETSKVLRFCIDTNYKNLNKELDDYNLQLAENINNAIKENIETKSNVSNISGVTKYEPFCNKYINLTSSEKVIMKNAIKYLESSIHNIVLVDIFPREFNNKNTGVGTINITNLDTHTVLLYKTIENEILVLDPNNPMFSSHLNKYQDNNYTIKTLCTTDPFFKIYSRPENTETGYTPTKYRDCIDIAVKIAFVLNNSGNTYQNITDIMNSQVIKLITNNSNIDNMIFSNHDLIKQKQSSNFEKIIDCNQKMMINSALENLKREKALEDFTIKTNEIKIDYNNTINKIDEEHTIYIAGMVNDYNPEL